MRNFNKKKKNATMSAFTTACQQTIHFSPVPACITDLDGIILYGNDSFFSLLQNRKVLTIGKPLNGWLVFPDDSRGWLDIIAQQNKEPVPGTIITQSPESEYIQVRAVVGKLENEGEYYYAFYFILCANDNQHCDSDPLYLKNLAAPSYIPKQRHNPAEKIQNRDIDIEKRLKHIANISRKKQNIDFYLKELAELVAARRVVAFQFDFKFTRVQFASEWSSCQSLKVGEKLWQLDFSQYSWWLTQMKNQETLVIPDIKSLPVAASNEKQLLRSLSIKSIIALPLWVDYTLTGFVALDISDSDLPVSEVETGLLEILVHLIGESISKIKISDHIRMTERYYRKLIKSAFQAVCIHDNGRILYINKAGAALFGVNHPKELTGKNLFDFVHPEEIEMIKTRISSTGISPLSEQRYIKANGELFYVEICSMCIKYHGKKAHLFVIRDITERKRIEVALKESEQRYRVLFELSPLGIVLTNIEGSVLQANRKIAEVMGYSSPEDMIAGGKKIRDYIISEQWEQDDQNIQELFATDSMKSKEYIMLRADNTPIHVEVDVLLLRDINNKPVSTIGVIHDITEKKLYHQQLLESEKRYRSLAEAARDMIFIIDRDGTVLYINNYAAHAVGLTPADIVGKKRADFFSGNDAQRQKESLGRVFVTSEPFYIETETVFAGKKIWVGTWLVPLKNDQGEVYAVQGISRDISERIKIERELQKSREQYKLLVENQGDLIIKMDAGGKILFASPSFCVTFNKEEQELPGNNFLSFIHNKDRKSTKQNLKNLFVPPYRCHMEQRMLTKDGWRWFSWIKTAIIDEKPQVIEIIGVGRDIQEQKDMELQLRASEERFRELAELLPEIVYEIDLNNKFTFVNHVAFASLGVTREQFENGLYAQDMVIPQDRMRMAENMERIKRGEPTLNSEYQALRNDGSTFPVISRSTTIKRNGQIVGFRGVITNITQLKETETALIAYGERFRDIIERSIDGYYFINKDGVIEFLNKAAMRIFDMNTDQLNALDVFKNRDAWLTTGIDVEKRFLLIMSGKPEPGCEIPLHRQTGEIFWISYNGRRVIENGIVKGIEGFIKDITQQKRIETEIRNSEARYRTLFRNIPFEVFNLGYNGVIRDANNKFREKWVNLVRKKSEKTANDLLLLQIIHQLVVQSRKSGQVTQHQYEIKNGEKCTNYKMILGPILVESKDVIGFIGMNIDITDQVWAIEQSKNFSAQLVQTQEEERAHISREIHDSLGQILTALQFELSAVANSMKTDRALAEQKLVASRQTLSDAIDEARNLCALLRPQLLDDFGLDIALKDYTKEFAKRWNIAIEYKSDNYERTLTNDIEISLYRVAQEALNNILKYANATQVTLKLEQQDGKIVLYIKDNGTGFDPQALHKNTQFHFGLIGMKERVEYLSGDFIISSEPGHGTLIKAIVPAKYKV